DSPCGGRTLSVYTVSACPPVTNQSLTRTVPGQLSALPPRMFVRARRRLQRWRRDTGICGSMSMPERGAPDLPHPALQAMLCADNAIREAGTNKVTLVGIFDQIFGTAFPLTWTRPIFVYMRITDAQGVSDSARARARRRLASNEIIIGLPPEVSFERPEDTSF